MNNRDDETLSIRALNFDLDTKKLKQYYPSNSIFGYKNAYRDIGKFLQANGFKHRQWSGYVSREPLTNFQVTDIINKLALHFPWLSKCVNQFDLTNISELYSVIDIIHSANINLFPSKNIINSSNKSIEERLKAASQKADELNLKINKPLHKDKEINRDL